MKRSPWWRTTHNGDGQLRAPTGALPPRHALISIKDRVVHRAGSGCGHGGETLFLGIPMTAADAGTMHKFCRVCWR